MKPQYFCCCPLLPGEGAQPDQPDPSGEPGAWRRVGGGGLGFRVFLVLGFKV